MILYIMYIKFITFFYLITSSISFVNKFNKPRIFKLNINEDLKKIDEEVDTLVDKLKKLKKEKIKLLSINNEKGLKLYNETDIKNNGEIKYDDDDERADDDIGNNDKTSGIRVIFPSNLFKQTQQPTHSEDDDGLFEIYKNTSYSFKDFGGYQNIKDELMQVSDMLVNYEKYSKYNVKIPRGLIFDGPSGVGKTLLAKCFAGELNISFIPVSAGSFEEKYVGVGAKRVRQLFNVARENKPTIIFIDEIDAVGRKRSSSSNSDNNSERDKTLNELLIELDGFKTVDGIFLICATNRVDLLDPALVRPGRIDKKIHIGLPDKETREKIINIHIEGKPTQKLTIEHLVEITKGLSGAEIENLLNEAMLYALRNDKEYMTNNDIEIILNKIHVGWQSTETKLSDNMRLRIATHELGHAIVGLLLPDYPKLVKISLNSNSPKILGHAQFDIPDNDINIYTKDKLHNRLCVLFGGLIAEQEIFGSISNGGGSDLENAYELASNMIQISGMGNNFIYSSLSDKSKEKIDDEINLLLKNAYTDAKNIILNSKELIKECAKILFDDSILLPDVIIKKINQKYNYLLKNNNDLFR